ncbi:MAG: type II secretion system protein [Verrucomicrobiota bacterium]
MKASPFVPRASRSSAAFTLIELLTVIVIIAVLVSLSTVGFTKVQQQVRSMGNSNNLRQCAQLMLSWSAESGYYPRLGNNRTFFDTNNIMVGDEWYHLPGLEEEMITANPLDSPLLSPAVEPEMETPPTGDASVGVITHFAYLPGPANNSPTTNPPLPVGAIANPTELILLADQGPESTENGEKYLSAAGIMMGDAFDIATTKQDSDPNEPVTLTSPYLEFRQRAGDGVGMDFARHRNGKTQMVFLDGHVESRRPGDFFVKNFVPQ